MKAMIEVGVLGAALVASLTATYLIHHHDGSDTNTPVEGVPVYSASVGDLTRVTFDSTDNTVVLERRNDAQGEYLWVTTIARKEKAPTFFPPPAADPDDPDATPPPPAPVEIEEIRKDFLGNEQADKVWEAFAPFRASRSLDVSATDLDLGFDDPYARLNVERRSGSIELLIGNATYGDRSRYLRANERVFLIEKRALSRLEGSGSTLAERRLHPLGPNEVAAVVVRDGAREQRFVQRNADDRAKAYWARAETQDTADRTAGSWLTSAGRLSASEFLSERPEGLEPVVSLRFEDRRGKVWPVELYRSADAPTTYYAESPFTRSLVTLPQSQGEDLTMDLDTLFQAAPPSSE
jgi:hypothetical protein